MKNVLPLVVALVLGLLAVFGVQRYLTKKDEEVRKKTEPQKVIVASRNIKEGERLSDGDLQLREFPKSMLPKNVVLPEDVKDVINQPVSRDVFKGEPLLWSFLGALQTDKTMSEVILPGERVISIPIDSIGGIDGYVRPNDRVDVYAHMSVPFKKKQEVMSQNGDLVNMEVEDSKDVVFILLQNVSILATGDSFYAGVNPGAGYRSISIAVSPEEAGILKFAMERGKLTLTLRNLQDFSELTDIDMIDMDSFMDVAKLQSMQQARTKRIATYKQGKVKIIER